MTDAEYADRFFDLLAEFAEVAAPLFRHGSPDIRDRLYDILMTAQQVQEQRQVAMVNAALDELVAAGDIEMKTADNGELWIRLTEQGRTNPQYKDARP